VRFFKERGAATLQTTSVCCSGEKPKYDLDVEFRQCWNLLFIFTNRTAMTGGISHSSTSSAVHNNVIADMKYSYRFLLGFIGVTVLRTSMHLSFARSSCIVNLINWRGLV
jgi:hypothetical protein